MGENVGSNDVIQVNDGYQYDDLWLDKFSETTFFGSFDFEDLLESPLKQNMGTQPSASSTSASLPVFDDAESTSKMVKFSFEEDGKENQNENGETESIHPLSLMDAFLFTTMAIITGNRNCDY